MSAVSLAEAKQFLQIGYNNQDLIVQILIDSAQQFVEEKTGFKLDGEIERIDTVDGGVLTLFPNSFPVVSVSEVFDLRSNSVVSADLYRLVNDGIQLLTGTRWLSGGHFETADRHADNQQRFRLTYNGGFATAPARFKEVILQLMHHDFDNRGGKLQQSAAGYGTTWQALMKGPIGSKIRALIHGSMLV